MYILILLLVLCSSPVSAASLYWDKPTVGDVNIEFSASETGPFTVIATVPSTPAIFLLQPGAFGYYRLTQFAFISNTVRFSTDVQNGLEAKVDQILSLLQEPTGNLKATIVDADHIQIIGSNCVKLSTTGSGLNRTITCVH